MATTAARLRRAFHYPSGDNPHSDDDDESVPSIMDEQEQESLITTLSIQNRTRNLQFTRLLILLPLLATIPFLLGLLSLLRLTPSTPPPSPLFSLLGLTSLAATGYLLLVLPSTKTGVELLDDGRVWDFAEVKKTVSEVRTRTRGMGTRPRVGGMIIEEKSPLTKHLPWMNLVLSLLVALLGLVKTNRVPEGGIIGLGNLPLVVNAVVVVSKMVMAGVDPEKEMSGLRYGYKGA